MAFAYDGGRTYAKKKAFDCSKALIKIGNDLLSQVLSQYHQRWRA